MKSIRTNPSNHAAEGDERIRTAVPVAANDPLYEHRCPSLHPLSTKPSRCERPRGHSGDHWGVCYSGRIKVYPSKWDDSESGVSS